MSTASILTAALAAGLTGAAAAAPTQASNGRVPFAPVTDAPRLAGETYVAPHEGRPVPLGGSDGAAMAPLGTVFFQAADHTPTGASDAQIASMAPARSPLQGLRDRLYVTEQEGVLWVRGRTYKASIDASGFTYIPFLGSDAPRNYPTSFRLASATLGGESLRLDAAAQVRQSGERFVLDRGPVEVVYDVALDSVEQSFVLDVRGGEGDLVLTLAVDSVLEADVDGAGFRFAGPDGGMDYSAAIVFDAAGRVADVPATLTGGSLRLTVPASFLASAEGQIVVDPIFSTFSVDTVGGNQTNADVAYDATTDTFTYVYEDTFSGADVDIYRTTVDINGAFQSGAYIDSSSEVWGSPSIANLNWDNAHLTVATRINATTGFSEIVGRVTDILAPGSGPVLLIGNANASWENFRPDVGGNGSATSGSWFVVWERRFSATQTLARGALVSSTGSVGAFVQITPGASNVQQEEVVISKSTGDSSTVNIWSIAMRQEDLGTNTDTIVGVQLNAAGNITNTASTLYTDTNNSRLREIDISDAIDVDGQASPTYLVVFDDYSSTTADAELLLCRDNQLVQLGSIALNEREHAITARDQSLVRLGTTRDDFVVSYLERDPSGSGNNVYVTTLDLTEANELAISERRTLVGNTEQGTGSAPALASRFSGGLTSSRYTGVAYAQFDPGSNEYDMHGLVHFASNGFAQAFQYCDGNPNSTGDRGFITLYGDRSTTSAKTLTASALPLNSVGFFINGRGFANIANPGGSLGVLCVGGAIGRYSASAASSGSTGTITMPIDPTMLQTPTGPVPALVGQFWQFQLWHRDSMGGVAVSNFTNACTLAFR